MKVDQLKAQVASHRARLKEKAGKLVTSDKAGPVGMDVTNALVSAIEELDKRIADLEAKGARGES